MKHDYRPEGDPSYLARMAEEEAKLRWLIARQPEYRELSYYLIFLLAAQGRYAKAIEECRRILKIHPGDIVGQMWRELIRLRWLRVPRRPASNRRARRDRRWHRIQGHMS